MQVSHGKVAPLRRIQPGDAVVYYSPTESLGDKGKLRAFTAIGIYYNETRTHLGLGKDGPLRRVAQRSVVTVPVLFGLHRRYARI